MRGNQITIPGGFACMSDFSAFADLMKEFIEFFDTLIPIEQDKLDATVKNRVGILEDFMHKEQAAVMRLRGLEQKREAELKRLGLEGCTFRQILEKIPDTDAAMLKPLFDRVDSQVRVMQSLSGSIKDAIEVNLRVIELKLAGDPAGNATYSAAGQKAEKNSTKHFSNRSV